LQRLALLHPNPEVTVEDRPEFNSPHYDPGNGGAFTGRRRLIVYVFRNRGDQEKLL
jgi:hypothetical protein